MTDSTEKSASEWTKGPWSFRYYMEPVGKHDDNFHLIDGPEGDQGKSILEGSFVIPGTHSDALKIARLITAAPNLYKALDDLVDAVLHDVDKSRRIGRAQAALNEALGK